jgi:hypothetical protein
LNIGVESLRALRLIALFSLLSAATANGQGTAAGSIPHGSASISGRVTDALTKQPIAGCMVSLNELYVTPSRNARTTTNSDGVYAFADICDGQYHVNTWCEPHLPTCYRSPGTDATGCDAVAVVVDQRKTNVDIALIRGATVRGRVVDQRGRPIASATVRLGILVGEASFLRMQTPVRTNRNGSFELSNLPPGKWRLELELPERPDSLRAPVLYFPGVLQIEEAGSIELVAGQTVDDLTFVAPAISDNILIVRVVTIERELSQLDVSFVRVEPLVSRPVPIDSEGMGTVLPPFRSMAFASASRGYTTASRSIL